MLQMKKEKAIKEGITTIFACSPDIVLGKAEWQRLSAGPGMLFSRVRGHCPVTNRKKEHQLVSESTVRDRHTPQAQTPHSKLQRLPKREFPLDFTPISYKEHGITYQILCDCSSIADSKNAKNQVKFHYLFHHRF